MKTILIALTLVTCLQQSAQAYPLETNEEQQERQKAENYFYQRQYPSYNAGSRTNLNGDTYSNPYTNTLIKDNYPFTQQPTPYTPPSKSYQGIPRF